MGKAALAKYRARKAQKALLPQNWERPIRDLRPRGSRRGLLASCEAVFQNERLVTRIVAALMHNVPLTMIARDLRVPRRAVAIIDLRERHL